MSLIHPFKAIRPAQKYQEQIPSLPYDVMNREEAKAMAEGNPLSFLHVVRAEINFPDDVDMYSQEVYDKGKEVLDDFIARGALIQDEKPKLYIYRQIMDGRVQTGLVACASVDEYLSGDIKKHEKTLEAKQQDRTNHFDTANANTAPIFLTYRHRDAIDDIIRDYIKFHKPTYNFTSDDAITHIAWVIEEDEIIERIVKEFEAVDALYIADGHHRSASAVSVGQKRREEFPDAGPEAEFNYFMAVIFPDRDLFVMDYNRIVKDLNGHSKEEFLDLVGENFDIREVKEDETPFKPMAKARYGMYLDGKWYELKAHDALLDTEDPVELLDVQILQQNVLDPILDIKDPRTSDRIDFVGGIRGIQELADRVDSGDFAVAFSMYPTSMDELLGIADADKIMPPKSTWFEPKLRSGLFVHSLED